MIKIITYQQVNSVSFGSEEVEVIAEFGEPNLRRLNNEKEIELHYPKYIARLSSDSKLFREFTLLPACQASVNDIQVVWKPAFLTTIQKVDTNLVEVLGFILSLKLGLAFSGFQDDDLSQMAVHAFRQGDWDIFLKRMKPFRYE